MRLVIKRDEWLRGEGGLRSFLLRKSDGKRCCVGIYLRELGVTDDQIANIASPHTMGGLASLPDQAKWLVAMTGSSPEYGLVDGSLASMPTVSQGCSLLMGVNDYIRGVNDPAYSDEISSENDREEAIKSLFLEYGNVEVEFV